MNKPHKNKFFVFRLIDGASTLGGMAAAACLLVVTLIITYEVVMRYVFNAPTFWVKELSIYLCMAIGFLGAAFALKNDSHFSITIIIDRLSRKNRRRMRILTNLMGMAYSVVFIYKGGEMAKFSYDIGDVSSGMMEVPLWIPWLLVPVGGTLLTFQFFKKLIEEARPSAESS